MKTATRVTRRRFLETATKAAAAPCMTPGCSPALDGWIHVTEGGKPGAEPESILTGRKIDGQSRAFMDGQAADFVDGARSRELTVSHPELSRRTHTALPDRIDPGFFF